MSAEHIVRIVLESEYGGYHDPVARSIIRALSDAGLLARPLPSREQIADELSGWPIGAGYYASSVANDEARDMADAVLALLKGQDA